MASQFFVTRFVVIDCAFLLALRKSDRGPYVDRYQGRDWHESKISRVFVGLCRDARCVLDIGAHVGWYTCLAAIAAPLAEITAFEMHATNALVTRRNIAVNGLKHAKVVNTAVCDRHRGIASFQIGRSTLEHRLAAPGNPGVREVRTVSIDGWCEDGGQIPEVVKIDVEGAEIAVLRGMRRILKQYSPSIIVEVHSAAKKAACAFLLSQFGYEPLAVRLGRKGSTSWSNEVLIARSPVRQPKRSLDRTSRPPWA